MICPIPGLLCAVVREEKVKLETTKIFTAILHLHCISFFFICFTFTEYELVQLFQRWSEDTAIHQLIIIIILIPCQVEKRSWTSQICNLCHLSQEHETEPVAKTKAISSESTSFPGGGAGKFSPLLLTCQTLPLCYVLSSPRFWETCDQRFPGSLSLSLQGRGRRGP